jgi:methionyl-tRNA synthetase
MFPSMLMRHGDYILPDNVPANEFLNLEGEKLSTSRGWAVWLHEYLDDFGDDRGPDLLRYALATTLPETKDADFSWEGFQNRVNGELADVLGNFVNRTLTFAHRYFDGEVPPLTDPSDADQHVLDTLSDAPEEIGHAYENYRMREAVFETMAVARTGNKYFNDTEPWHTRDTDPQAAANTIHLSLQICAALSILFEPVIPDAAQRLRDMLRLSDVRSSTPEDDPAGVLGWEDAAGPILNEGHTLGEPDILFGKLEDDTIEAQIEKLRERAAQRSDSTSDSDMDYTDLKDNIEFDDFTKLDLRVGTITTAEPVPDADKLLRLEVDLGFEERQILAGVAEQMDPAEVEGLQVVVVANMAPKEMFSLQSEGMVLMAEEADGTFVPVSADANNGSVVR